MTKNLETSIYDVCIIGAGPAGLTGALELANYGLHVVLVESGNSRHIEVAQKLSDAIIENKESHSIMADAVRRGLGGTSKIWGGRCVPLDDIDFEKRDFVNDSEWPFDANELKPYYTRACEILSAGKPIFRSKELNSTKSIESRLSSNFHDTEELYASHLERWSSEPNIWTALRNEIEKHPKISIITGKTCIGFSHSSKDLPVNLALLKSSESPESETQSIEAKFYIIACGGIESTRLILNSIENPSGLKITSPKLVGRYYMGHPSGKIADIEFHGKPSETIYGFEKDNKTYIRRRITFPASFLKNNNILNIAFWLDNPPIADWRHGSGVLSAAYLALTTPILRNYLAPTAIRKRAVGEDHSQRVRHILNCLSNPIQTLKFCASFGYKRYIKRPRIPGFFTYSPSNRYALHYHAEQAPNWDSTIKLSNQIDAHGMKKASINLIWSRQDIESIIKAHKLLAEILEKNGIGKLIYRFNQEDLNSAIHEQAIDGFHQIGTLRMAKDIDRGVTDAYGRLYGTSNCFISSSAVFPTSGQANPTLAIVALGIRQAKHIAEIIKKN